jgi:hypothetical protein
MGRHALTFTVRPGTESEAAAVLTGYGRPQAGARPGRPLLQRTSVFLAGNRVIRIADVAGTLGEALAHLSAQPQIRAVEQALDPHLERPRDMTTPQGLREFLRNALVPVAHRRHTPAELLPGDPARRDERILLLYPVRSGAGAEVAGLLARTRVLGPATPTVVAGTTVFRRGDLVLRLIEVHGDPDTALAEIAEAAVRGGAAEKLAPLVEADEKLGDPDGFALFLRRCSASLLTDRRIGAPL